MTSSDDERLATDEELFHYGTPRRSGRYPWGSGDSPMQSGRDWIAEADRMQRQGMSQADVAKAMGLKSSTELRALRSIARAETRQDDAALARRLKLEKNMSNVAIGQRMGIPESTVRTLLNPALEARRSRLENTAGVLETELGKGGYLDVGKGTENWMGIPANQLNTAVTMLTAKGYTLHNIQQPQQFGKGLTTIKVLAPPGTTRSEVYKNKDRIRTVAAFSTDGGKTLTKIEPPVPVNSKRVAVRWAEQGGGNADGVIYIRPGVPDLSLGGSRYAQVRIAVDKGHYLKGMAMYKDDLPAGVDLLFNTSKHDTGDKLDAMKPGPEDAETPWTTWIRYQKKYTDAQGNEKTSPLNIVNEEGHWRDWRPTLSSQILSKQSNALAKRQLDQALTDKEKEFGKIMELTNPVVKQKLLHSFADSADSDSVHLKAAAMPRQQTHVILPFDNIREHEIFAPNYNNGEKVVLIRHPHGGTFEIPELTVNNRNRQARQALFRQGRPPVDAVGIHPKVAKQLSGADFDGDAVLVIPNPYREIRRTSPLKELDKFDPKEMYAPWDGMPTIDKGHWNAKTQKTEYPAGRKPSLRPKQQQMGDVSNLITDMTIKGATPDKIARAVKHSMVVIDSEKHALDVKRSYRENGIAALKAEYQGQNINPKTGRPGRLKGASTIVSRAGSVKQIPERRPRPYSLGGPIDRATGRKAWEPTGKMTVNKKGETVTKQIRIKRLADEVDARKLISDANTPMEQIYAAHSNSLKALANHARLESLRTGTIHRSPTAYKTYTPQVSSLNAKLNKALKNAPLERQAQLIANAIVRIQISDNPSIRDDPDELKKVKARALQTARTRVGAGKDAIEITSHEWEAIQSGAISANKLGQIIDNANMEQIKILATPRKQPAVSAQMLSIARSRLASGYTQAEVANSLGIPVSTLNTALLGEEGG
jgi:transcriptional regulator with XRE-family HTH domain